MMISEKKAPVSKFQHLQQVEKEEKEHQTFVSFLLPLLSLSLHLTILLCYFNAPYSSPINPITTKSIMDTHTNTITHCIFFPYTPWQLPPIVNIITRHPCLSNNHDAQRVLINILEGDRVLQQRSHFFYTFDHLSWTVPTNLTSFSVLHANTGNIHSYSLLNHLIHVLFSWTM